MATPSAVLRMESNPSLMPRIAMTCAGAQSKPHQGNEALAAASRAASSPYSASNCRHSLSVAGAW